MAFGLTKEYTLARFALREDELEGGRRMKPTRGAEVMSKPIRWGILGTGSIARKFAQGLSVLPDAKLDAVGSRAGATADAFGDEFNVPRRHGSYQALAEDPEVDVIYIATPHPMHVEDTLLCLENGKAVLCEKPFAINAKETTAMIRKAREKKLFLMEAMWTRFIPAVVKAREWVEQGAIGDVRMVAADFGFRAGWNETSRLLNKELGGGALLDVGIYAVSFASMILRRQPDRVASLAHLGQTGVDEEAGMILGYDKGELAVLYTAVRTNTPQAADILGADGSIHIPAQFWKATRAVLTTSKGVVTAEMPHVGNGYNYQAAEVMRCMREGRLESPVMSLDETLAIMQTMDRIREQWGLKYPMD